MVKARDEDYLPVAARRISPSLGELLPFRLQWCMIRRVFRSRTKATHASDLIISRYGHCSTVGKIVQPLQIHKLDMPNTAIIKGQTGFIFGVIVGSRRASKLGSDGRWGLPGRGSPEAGSRLQWLAKPHLVNPGDAPAQVEMSKGSCRVGYHALTMATSGPRR